MWVKENGSNNSTIIQTGKYLVLTNVSASDKGLYVCFAAVTSSQSLEYDDQNENNSTSLREHEQQIDKDEVEQNDDDDENENGEDDADDDRNEQVLLTSTTTKINHNDNDTTFVKPLVENKNIIIHKTTTRTQNASTTSMLPMPNVTRTATTTKTPTLSVSASATASASATTTTIVIKTLTNANFSTLHSTNLSRIPDHNNTNNSSNSYHSFSNSRSSSSNSSSDLNLTTFTPITSSTIDDIEEQEFQAFQKINLTVRTPPGPVTKLYFKASTILGFLIWRFNKTNSGGYPVRSFTAEFRNVSYVSPPFNSSFEHKWSRMDPINIAPNVRQMEVYRLEPNTTYEFRIWANNQLGSGEVVTTNVTTLPETKEEEFEDGWDSIELIPNIILNPGFCETDGQPAAPRTVIFGGDDDSDDSCESESDHEPRMEKFKRKLSVFFTDPTIYRSHI
ncbi:uncharacterized protein LOC119607227 isoform X2 [Lucilia sericata]|uniref:uncharacterized protein LOC119607227 isoform X2 n=1 Tax=Lucilia sericata TaxID=13632 RepID=UPI0018A8517A|nr:uncharacterized protein LOC119607227 isoform X2 [Lucilia sericata]